MKTWEYKTLSISRDLEHNNPNWEINIGSSSYKIESFENFLNELGSEGWELVATVPVNGFARIPSVSLSVMATEEVIYLFKREKSTSI